MLHVNACVIIRTEAVFEMCRGEYDSAPAYLP